MASVRHGLRNLNRNRPRALLVVVFLALAVAVSATAAQAGSVASAQADQLERDVATLLRVVPRTGGVGSGAAGMSEDVVAVLAEIPGVAEVNASLAGGFQDNDQRASMGLLIGVVPGDPLRLQSMGGFTDTPTLVAGRSLGSGDDGAPVAVVGAVFADQYGVGVGDDAVLARERFRPPIAADLRVRVVGIYETGVVFGDNQVFVPLSVAQEALGRPEEVDSVWVRAASAEAVPTARASVESVVAGRGDVVGSGGAAAVAATALDALRRRSGITAAVTAIAAAVLMGTVMVLVIRERRREVGVLKAIGASNRHVAGQFLAEAATLGVLGSALGLLAGAAAGPGLSRLVLSHTGSAPSAAAALAGAATAVGSGLLAATVALVPTWWLTPADVLRSD